MSNLNTNGNCSPNVGALPNYYKDVLGTPIALTSDNYPLYGSIGTNLGRGTVHFDDMGATKINVYDKDVNDVWVHNDGYVNAYTFNDTDNVLNKDAYPLAAYQHTNDCYKIYDPSSNYDSVFSGGDKVCTVAYSDSDFNNRSMWGKIEPYTGGNIERE